MSNGVDKFLGAEHDDGQHIPHYHGDGVRICFIAAAILMTAITPFSSTVVPLTIIALITGVVLLVVFAALTHPHGPWIMAINAMLSATGAAIFETFAIVSFQNESWVAFVVQEFIVVLFLFALYFAMRTLRAMMLHQVGKQGRFGEFENE